MGRWGRPLIVCAGVLNVVLALLVPRLIRAQGPPTEIRLEPATAQVGVGETVTLEVVVENVSDLQGVEAQLLFNPALMQVVDADPESDGVQIALGPFLSADAVVQNAADQNAGLIAFAYSQSDSSGPVDGSGVVASITFEGIVPGVSTVSFTGAGLVDASAQPIPADLEDGQVTVLESATPTPTPEVSPTATPVDTPTATPVVTPTVAPTPTPTPTPAPTFAPEASPTPDRGAECEEVLGQHVVRPREYLYAIGRAYAVRPDAIARCNGILNPSLIHAGTALTIPDVAWVPVPPGTVAAAQFGGGATHPCRASHTILSGENLFRISLRYGVSMWAIAEANHIHNLHYIRAGDTLCIP